MGGLTIAREGEVGGGRGIHLPRRFETFDGANSATLGPDLPWYEGVAGNWSIVSSAAEAGGGAGLISFATLDVDLGSLDHYLEATVSQLDTVLADQTQVGARLRDRSPSGVFDWYSVTYIVHTGRLQISRTIGFFANTILLDVASAPPAAPFLFRAQVVGSTVKAFANEVEIGSVTDGSPLTAGTRVGISGFTANGTVTRPRIRHLTAGSI